MNGEARAFEIVIRLENIEKALRSYHNSSWENEKLEEEKQELEKELKELGC